MGGRGNVRQVELRHLRDRVEDLRELLPEELDLRLRQLQPREPRNVQHFVPCDSRHASILPDLTFSPVAWAGRQRRGGPSRSPLATWIPKGLEPLDVRRL